MHLLIDTFLKLHDKLCCEMCEDMDKREPDFDLELEAMQLREAQEMEEEMNKEKGDE